MKKCNVCNRTYPDDTLAFCLEDGALLSASYNPQETQTPTVAISAGIVPTVFSGAEKIPTVAAQEIPTVVTSSRPTQQAQADGVGWKIYLAGLFISLIVETVYIYLLYPFYARAMSGLSMDIASRFDDYLTGYMVSNFIIATPLNTFVYALLAFVLGFVWSRGKWKWGVIVLIPNFVIILYYLVINLFNGRVSTLYILRLVISNIVYLIATCLFAYIGSWLSSRIFSRQQSNYE